MIGATSAINRDGVCFTAFGLMLTFETHNVEPALAELSEAASRYFHDRLIAPEMRPEISVTLRLVSSDHSHDVSGASTPIGLQHRDMLAVKRKGKMIPPFMFDCIIARHDDVLQTMLTLAHEWIRIAQVCSGRYILMGKPPRPGKPEKYIAQWCGTKIGLLDQIPFAARPWEIEAHEWQHKLVSEFVDRYAKDEGM